MYQTWILLSWDGRLRHCTAQELTSQGAFQRCRWRRSCDDPIMVWFRILETWYHSIKADKKTRNEFEWHVVGQQRKLQGGPIFVNRGTSSFLAWSIAPWVCSIFPSWHSSTIGRYSRGPCQISGSIPGSSGRALTTCLGCSADRGGEAVVRPTFVGCSLVHQRFGVDRCWEPVVCTRIDKMNKSAIEDSEGYIEM